MAHAPGGAGLPIMGDRTVEFYRDANAFVNSRIDQYNSRIFQSRLLNKPSLILASNTAVREALYEKSDCMELGYKSFMHQVYGDNICFMDGSEADCMRDIMKSLFGPATVEKFQGIINKITFCALEKLSTSEPVQVYSFMKRLTTEICLSIFLDIDFETSAELANNIVSLTTKHWHGIISLPLNLRIPGLSQSSGFTKALEAKAELLEIINKKLLNPGNSFPQVVSNITFPRHHDAANHLLLFTSALVPKAMSSILTSFVLELANKKDAQEHVAEDPTFLNCVLLEIKRMSPPFVGGRRLVRKDCTIGGYHVPSGHAVVYMTRQAQRDPEVFHDPDNFLPDRWMEKNLGDEDKLYLFGGGSRCCIGQELVNNILTTITSSLVKQYCWECADPKDLKYKWLPVSRPVEGVHVRFTCKPTRVTTS